MIQSVLLFTQKVTKYIKFYAKVSGIFAAFVGSAAYGTFQPSPSFSFTQLTNIFFFFLFFLRHDCTHLALTGGQALTYAVHRCPPILLSRPQDHAPYH